MKIFKCTQCNYERISRNDFDSSKKDLKQNIKPTYLKVDLKCPRCISKDKNGLEHDISINQLL